MSSSASPSDDLPNFALASTGATIVEVSHEALHVASAASNLLLEREDMLWITSDAPQSVTIRVAPNHPPLTFVGWHVWHDYLSNPKVVEVASGILPDCLSALIVCNAIPGAGTQLWELGQPIPSAHQYVRFTIQSTFAPGPTYMNNVCLFAQNPGPKYGRIESASSAAASRHRNAGPMHSQVAPQGGSSTSRTVSQEAGRDERRSASNGAAVAGSVPISNLLRDLDEDIKSLHPIRTVSPTRNVIFSQPNASLPSLVDTEIGEYVAAARRSPSAQQHRPAETGRDQSNRSSVHHQGQMIPNHSDPLSVVDNTTFRLAALEQAVTSLTRALENQRQDIAGIRELLANQRRQGPQTQGGVTPSSSAQQKESVEVNFPEESLKAFIDDVLAPKLAKLAKRTETKTLERLEEHVTGMLDSVSDVVDRRVRGYLKHLSADHGVPSLRDGGRQQTRGDSDQDEMEHSRRGHGDVRQRSSATEERTFRGSAGAAHQRLSERDIYERPVKPTTFRR